jgi:ACDE family multidrug resistance protein
MNRHVTPDTQDRGPTGIRGWLRAPLVIAFATSVASTSGATLLYPVLPVVASSLAVDTDRIGLVIAVFTAPAMVLAPIFGVIADRHGRRWMLILGLTLFGLAGGAAALAPSFSWLLALRALQGVGASAILPLTIVLISDLLPEEKELRGQGLKVVIDRVAMIGLPVLGGALAAVAWQWAFLPYVITVPLAIAAYVWMPETSKPEPETLRQYLGRTMRAAAQPRLATAFGTGFIRFFLDYGLYTYLPLFLALRYGVTTALSGWLIALSAVGSIVTALRVEHLHRSRPAERLLVVAFLASAAGLAIIALNPALWLIGLALFVFGMGNGLISPLQKSLLTRKTPAHMRGGVISVDRVIQQIAKSLSPTAIGLLLLVADIEIVFWSLCAMSIMGALALGWMDSRRPA